MNDDVLDSMHARRDAMARRESVLNTMLLDGDSRARLIASTKHVFQLSTVLRSVATKLFTVGPVENGEDLELVVAPVSHQYPPNPTMTPRLFEMAQTYLYVTLDEWGLGHVEAIATPTDLPFTQEAFDSIRAPWCVLGAKAYARFRKADWYQNEMDMGQLRCGKISAYKGTVFLVTRLVPPDVVYCVPSLGDLSVDVRPQEIEVAGDRMALHYRIGLRVHWTHTTAPVRWNLE